MPGATPARATEAINVATPSRVIFALPFWIAERNGYFKDEGIDAKIDIVSDGREITRRLQTGVSQFSIVGPDAVFIDAVKGGPMRVVAGIVRKPPLFLIAKPSIKTFAQLRGANIGVLSLTEGSSKLLAKMLKAEGIDAADLKITQVGGAPARATLLKEGKIDAGMQPVPLNYEAEADGFNNLGWAGKYEPEWQFTTVNANGEWLKQKPEVATGFLRALVRAQQFIWSKPDEAAQIAADALKTPVAMASRSLAEAIKLGILDPKLDWSEAGLQRIYENMQADGALPKDQTFAAGKVTNAEYLRKAQGTAATK
jgi:ABC-type nitrate/sulfonate/bicarbonate transport system substrate-binding protein